MLKGASVNVNKALKVGGPIVAAGLEVPEIYNGYQISTHEGNKQVVGTAGSVGGGWLGGMAAGALYGGIFGSETGPFDILFVIGGAGLGAYYGEEATEKFFEKISHSKIRRNYNTPTFLNGYYGCKR